MTGRFGLRHWLYLAALVAVALLPRIYRLGDRTLWYDEAFSLWNAAGARPGRFVDDLTPFTHREWQTPPAGIRDVCDSVRATENTPPLYFLALSVWIRFFGTGESAVRSLSVIAGIATVALLPLLGRRALGARVGWGAGWLLAVSPLHIYFSREARNYALAGLFGTLMLLLWTGGGLGKRRREAALYALAATLGLYTNYLAGVLLLAQGAATAWLLRAPAPAPPAENGPPLPDPRRTLRAWAGAATGAALLFGPWLAYGAPQQVAEAVGYREAMAPVDPWLRNTFFFGAKLLFYLFLGETSIKLLFFRLAFLSWPVVALLAMAATGLWRRRRDGGPGTRGFLAALSVLLYLAGCVAICLATRTWMTVQTRFFVIVLPALAAAVAAGLTPPAAPGPRAGIGAALQRWGTPAPLVLLVVLTGALFLTPAWPLAARPDTYWGVAARFLEREAGPGDVIVLDGATAAVPLNVYYRGEVKQLALPPLDSRREAEASRALAGHPRIWLLSSRFRMDPPTRDRVLAAFRLASVRDFGETIRLSEYVAP